MGVTFDMSCVKKQFIMTLSFVFIFSVDATDDIFDKGRMINDAAKGDTMQNCIMKIVVVDKIPRLCIFASRNIQEGEELRYDYGVATLPWRKVDYFILANNVTSMSHKQFLIYLESSIIKLPF